MTRPRKYKERERIQVCMEMHEANKIKRHVKKNYPLKDVSEYILEAVRNRIRNENEDNSILDWEDN